MHDPAAPDRPVPREIALLTNPTVRQGRGAGARRRSSRGSGGRPERPQPRGQRRRRGPRPGPRSASPTASRPRRASAVTAWCTSASRRSPAPGPASGSSPPAPATTWPATSTSRARTRGRRRPGHRGARRARIDLARSGTKYFVTVLAAGFDAIVNERANAMTWPKGQMRYNLATLAELRTFKPIPYTLELDGEQRSSSTRCWSRWATGRRSAAGCGSPRAPARRRTARRGDHQADEQARAGADLPQAVQGHPHHATRSTSTTGCAASPSRRRASCRTPTASGSARCP